jgi:predicted phosphodiesterase
VGRARQAMAMFASCDADLLLAGHLHASHTGDTAERYKIGDFSALVVQAGTATSTRGRGEANSFNVLHIERPQVRIERFGWTGDDFALAGSETFRRTPGGWQRG